MWYWIFRSFFVVAFRLLFRLKAEGLENIPDKTNFIVVANHTSFLDPFAVGVAIPKRIYWVTARYLYGISWVVWFLRRTGTFSQGSASQKAISLLEANRNVGLFPEGQRSIDGKLQEFRRGAALLAAKTGRPVLPCAILGSFEALPRGARLLKLVPITVKVGKPVYILKEYEETVDDVYLQEGTLRIRNQIKEMLYGE